MPIDKTINQPDGADSRGAKPPTNPGDAARITTAGEYLASFGVATPSVVGAGHRPKPSYRPTGEPRPGGAEIGFGGLDAVKTMTGRTGPIRTAWAIFVVILSLLMGVATREMSIRQRRP